MRKFWITALALGAALAVALVPDLFRSPEPSYQGEPLGFWLEQLSPTPRRDIGSGVASLYEDEKLARTRVSQAQMAIRAMGPKAVPFLLDKIRREYSARERLYGAAWPKLPLSLRQRLSPPRQFRNYGSPRGNIVSALNALDAEAVPSLAAALNDSNSDVRITVLAALGGFGEKADSALPALLKLATDSNGFVRRWAILAIGRMGPKRTNALPILIAALKDSETSPLPGSSARVRETAVRALRDIGPPAQAGTAELQRLLKDSDHTVQQEAAIALWRINHDLSVLPLLITELKRNDEPKDIIEALGEMGPIAKPAIPAIKEAASPIWRFRSHYWRVGTNQVPLDPWGRAHAGLEEIATDAIHKIDPFDTDVGPEPNLAPDAGLVGESDLELRDRPGAIHFRFAAAQVNRPALRSGDKAAAPFWVKILDDPSPEARLQALLNLEDIGWTPEPESLAKLMPLLGDRGAFQYRGWGDTGVGLEHVCIGDLAAELIGQIGPEGRPAADSLRELLTDPIWSERPYAAGALWRIEHDTNVLASVIANLQHPANAARFRRFLAIAAEMGPAAKAAVPAILQGMTNLTADSSRPVREALEKIDPAAAAASR